MMLNVVFSILMIFGGGSNSTWMEADAGSILGHIPIEGLPKAQRITPPPPEPVIPTGINGLPFAPEGLDNCQEMNFYRVQAGLPIRFGDQPRTGPFMQRGIGWRESNCRNEESVHTFCCWGYWQMHQMHFRPGNVYDTECGVTSRHDIDSDIPIDKQRQACVANRLFQNNGYSPWQ